MGYTAYISGHCFRFTNVKKAHETLVNMGLQGATLEDCLAYDGFEEVELDSKGNVTTLYFSTKYRDEDRVFQELAAVIGPDMNNPDTIPFIEWVGEDDSRWRFIFIDGQMQEVDARIEWSYLSEQRTSDITVQPLTLDGVSGRSHLLTLIEEHIAFLEALKGQRAATWADEEEHSGYRHLPKDDIEQLIREEKMTWKAVRDAKQVILNIEAVDE